MGEVSGERRFSGQWVGATQGCAMPAHIWEIAQQGQRLTIATRWEDAPRVHRFYGRPLADGTGFTLADGRFRAVALGPQHFVVLGWDTNDARGGVGPHYDVIFARPGIAELAARAVYERYRKTAGGP
jgi:hypothetical protein